MRFSFTLAGNAYSWDSAQPKEISIPLNFYGPQPGSFGVAPAAAKPYRSGNFVGDTRLGGSCNFEQLQLVPHCNGTHTECIGHITDERFFVSTLLQDVLLPATLITLQPVSASASEETSNYPPQPTDVLLTQGLLKAALQGAKPEFLTALIIRTLPNSPEKCSYKYEQEPLPAYFTLQAIELLVSMNVQHLVVDLPSVDRLQDGGHLSAHHVFWQVPPGQYTLGSSQRHGCTITEFAYIPPALTDGRYVLNLQLPSFLSDAAPSRLFIYELYPATP